MGFQVINCGIDDLFDSPVRSVRFIPKELVPMEAESFGVL